jgi:hypothetical protein
MSGWSAFLCGHCRTYTPLASSASGPSGKHCLQFRDVHRLDEVPVRIGETGCVVQEVEHDLHQPHLVAA